jgi:hypothetical protein
MIMLEINGIRPPPARDRVPIDDGRTARNDHFGVNRARASGTLVSTREPPDLFLPYDLLFGAR